MANWYIARCRPGFEVKAAEEINRAGLKGYSPAIAKRYRTRTFKPVTRWRPLFVGYCFVHATEYELAGIRELDYVHQVLTRNGTDTPASLPAGLVEAISDREAQERRKYENSLERPSLQIGEPVEAIAGRWGRIAGTVYGLDSNGAIRILTKLLGAERVVKVSDSGLVERIAAE